VRATRPLRSLLGWAAGAAVVGAFVGIAIELLIAVFAEQAFDWWFVQQSVLIAEVITLSAVVGMRYAFPQFQPLPVVLRYGVILFTVVGAAIVATIIALLNRPLAVSSRLADWLALLAANTFLAIVVGSALIAWERLKSSLESAYEELRVKEAFEREMTLAREVQQELLPKQAPALAGYEICFLCRPAAAVGGDTFDFLQLPGGRVGMTVGDVVGKGIAAALLMASVQALVRAIAPREVGPDRVNQILSDALSHPGRPGRLVTFAYLLLEPASGRIAYSLAGHHPPLVVGSRGLRRLDKGGLPLGTDLPLPYEAGEDVLAEDETVIVYTDGLVEAPSAKDPDEEFGTGRLCELVRSTPGLAAEKLLDRVLGALAAHTGDLPAADDMTILILRRLPRARAADNPDGAVSRPAAGEAEGAA
jgi:hypothetical protein